MATSGMESATLAYLKTTADDFHAANPGIAIELDAAAPAGSAAPSGDIAVVATASLPELVEARLIEPLDAMMSAEFRSRFVPALLLPGQVKGQTYALPFTASAYALAYNTAMFAQAGIGAPPATWEDLDDAAERLKAAGLPGFGIPGKLPGSDLAWYCALWTYGGELVAPDGRVAFASPAGIRSLAFYRELIARGLTEPGAPDASLTDLIALFAKHELAMLLLDWQSVGALAATAPGLGFAVTAMPRGTRAATLVQTGSVVILRASLARQAAFRFIDFLFTKTPRMAFAKLGRSLPTTRAVLADRLLARDERLHVFATGLADARSVPTVDGWDEVGSIVADALRSAYSGATTPDLALREAAARAKKALRSDDQPGSP